MMLIKQLNFLEGGGVEALKASSLNMLLRNPIPPPLILNINTCVQIFENKM